MNIFDKSPQLAVILLLTALIAVSVGILKSKENLDINVNPVSDFPLSVGEWFGQSQSMDIGITEFLELTDYTIINYKKDSEVINFYIAFYKNLKDGAFPHSPKLCIPGGGWQIDEIKNIKVSNYNVRRVSIVKNNIKQIVYYWYQQGSKSIPDEYQLKWNNFVRYMKEGRTDTSLIRLTMVVPKDEQESSVDLKLAAFLGEIDPLIQNRLN